MEKQFRQKDTQELQEQLKRVENSLDEDLLVGDDKQDALFLSLEELQSRFPEKYEKYVSELRIGKNALHLHEQQEVKTYSPEEILEIQEAISDVHKEINPDLLEKINSDSTLRKYSLAIFFPGICERVFVKKEIPIFEVVATGERQMSASKVTFQDSAFIIKKIENPEEPKIAGIVAETNSAPKQFETLSGYLTEEFIDGQKITNLDPKLCTPEFMFELGKKFGIGYKKIHEKDIVINDQLLQNDFGKSHTIITPEGEIRFIDFGAAVHVSEYPNISNESIYNLMRTDPMIALSIAGISNEELPKAINHYRNQFLKLYPDKESLIRNRDGELLSQGLHFLSFSLPNVEAFSDGIMNSLAK